MKPMRRYGAIAAAAAALGGMALVVGGCGAANTIDPVAKAASISTTTPGFQMRFVVRFGSPQLPTALTATGTGSINARSRTGSVLFVMNTGNDPRPQEGVGRLDVTLPGARQRDHGLPQAPCGDRRASCRATGRG